MNQHTRTLSSLSHLIIFVFIAAPLSAQIPDSAEKIVINAPGLRSAHVGISIYEPATNIYWYNYQGDKYFVPASNTKIPTCYAAMKYLGDSLKGLKISEDNDRIFISGCGDPTLLDREYNNQPVINFLQNTNKAIWATETNWKDNGLGSGWSWSDYSEDYLPERSALPIFGNLVTFSGQKKNISFFPKDAVADSNFLIYSKNSATGFIDRVKRDYHNNHFILTINGNALKEIKVPFITTPGLSFKILETYINKKINGINLTQLVEEYPPGQESYFIHSQPTDSVLKPMMHRSDNFFAEQMLLMVSNEKLGYMNDEAIIDTLLNSDLKDLPQKPRWADGSGLSRYNLFTPQDFVFILNKMKDEFGMERVKNIFPTGGTGTISNYYKADSSFIYGKTGSLSGVIAFSGYLYTKQGKLLIFSTLVNNHAGAATEIRKAIERFLEGIRNNY